MADCQPGRTPCEECPLHGLEHFRDFSAQELAFVKSFKIGELTVAPGATVLVEGAHSAHLYTVLSGWGFRHKLLDDGRRQILNYVMPGDLTGLQGSVSGEMQHSVEALTTMMLCVFERDRISTLISNHPSLAYDMIWIAAREECILDEHLLSIGQRSATERAAYLLVFLYRRATAVGLLTRTRRTLPITQHLVADTLGLSLVHTNKTLRKIAKRGLVRWGTRGCEVLDDDGLAEIAGWNYEPTRDRPFI